jgi:hypothetical protein
MQVIETIRNFWQYGSLSFLMYIYVNILPPDNEFRVSLKLLIPF